MNATSVMLRSPFGRLRVFTFHTNKAGQVKLQLKKLSEWVGEQSRIDRF